MVPANAPHYRRFTKHFPAFTWLGLIALGNHGLSRYRAKIEIYP